jgi:hypothetical protein
MFKRTRRRRTKHTHARNLFTTTTGKTVLATLATLILAAAPNVQGLLSRRATDLQKQDLNDLIQIVLVLANLALGTAGTAGLLAAKHKLDPNTYTPTYLPGRNEDDVPVDEADLK